METEKMQFSVFAKDGKPSELIIREGKAPDMLPILPPIKQSITGTIEAVVEFLKRRKPVPDQINIDLCHILVNRDTISIQLIINESDPNTKGTITGKLAEHPKYIEFGVNQKKGWDPNELGQFFKMNRFFFADKSENMKIVSDLKNFSAKVESVIEKQKGDKGDFKDNYSGVVMSNLPGTFKLNLPIFKGQKAEEIEVEFYASVNGREVALQLVSPGANQLLEDIRNSVIDEQIKLIREIAPEIVIIEV
jgi:hypothetical protein